ncbi:MAG TPA: cyclic nucleotide-binding domain-containing protein [Actinomycetota bacterium]|nr:cyclic nucleotide-binding domain-containing protein [Actinomycetota bacterium]
MSSWTHTPTLARRGALLRKKEAERRAILATVPLFASLPPRQLRRVAAVSAVLDFPEGEEVVKEGQAGSTFYVIAEGAAKAVRGGRTVGRLEAGRFFGELAVLGGTPRTASVITTEPTTCVVLSSKNLQKVLREEPAVALQILGYLAHRLAEAERPTC